MEQKKTDEILHHTTRDKWLAMALLCGAAFMVILDSATVFTALPTIQSDLGFSVSGLQWVVNAYALSFGALMLLGGRMADLLGGRKVFIWGNIIFLVSSVFCGLAWSSEVLVISRIFQGIGAAVVTPSALSILMNIFPEGPERNRALGYWFSIAGVGGIMGFLVGGPLTDGPGWQWIFFMNIPMGLLVLAVTPFLIAKSKPVSQTSTFDIPGAVTITGALGALIYAISEVPEAGWLHVQTIGLLAASVILFVLFIRIESRSLSPLIPLHLFRLKTLVGGNMMMFLMGGIFSGVFFIMTLYTQQVLGYSAVEFSFAILPMAVLGIIGALVGQRMVTRFGIRKVAVTGTAGFGLSLLLLMRAPADAAYFTDLLPAFILIGLVGNAGIIAASIAALTGITEEDSGVASGIEESTWTIGSPIGIAILSTVAVTRTDFMLAGGTDLIVAQTAGFQTAFAAGAILSLIVIVIAVMTLPSHKEELDKACEDEVLGETELSCSIAPV